MFKKSPEADDSVKQPVVDDSSDASLEEGLVVEFPEIDPFPIVRQGNIVRLSTDALSVEARAAIHAELAEESGQTFFIGKIENGYSLQSARHPDQCPRCQSPTKTHMASLIYATNRGPRVLTTRGVHFCTACPTVIVDEDMVERSIAEEFEYRGLLGHPTSPRTARLNLDDEEGTTLQIQTLDLRLEQDQAPMRRPHRRLPIVLLQFDFHAKLHPVHQQ